MFSRDESDVHRTTRVEELSDSLTSLSDSSQEKRPTEQRNSRAELDMEAYHTLRADVVDSEEEERGNSIIDMSTCTLRVVAASPLCLLTLRAPPCR